VPVDRPGDHPASRVRDHCLTPAAGGQEPIDAPRGREAGGRALACL